MTGRAVGWLEVDGERIYYESVGEGNPVVLCHGLGGNHAAWWGVVPALASVHQVVTWDQRGFGNSTRRTGRYGPEVAVGDLVALLDHLGLRRAQVVGQSMGGWVAMGVALAHPERVRSIVLCDTLAGVFTDEVYGALSATASPAPAQGFGAEVGRHPALSGRFCAEHPDLAFLYWQISSMGDKPEDAEVFGMLAAMRAPVEQVAALRLPALLVVGEEDVLCPPAAMSHIADLVAGSELEVIAGAGHSPYFECPGRWLAAVGPFLGRHASS